MKLRYNQIEMSWIIYLDFALKMIAAYSFISIILFGSIVPATNHTCLELYEHSKVGKLKNVNQLLKKGVYINATFENNQTSLHVASQNGHTDTVIMLLNEGADLNIKNCPFDIRSFQTDWRIPIYDNGFTSLYWPAIKGYEDVVRVLIDSGADVNAQDRVGRTPLHLSIINGCINLVDLLISEGADVDIYDIEGKKRPAFCCRTGYSVYLK